MTLAAGIYTWGDVMEKLCVFTDVCSSLAVCDTSSNDYQYLSVKIHKDFNMWLDLGQKHCLGFSLHWGLLFTLHIKIKVLLSGRDFETSAIHYKFGVKTLFS